MLLQGRMANAAPPQQQMSAALAMQRQQQAEQAQAQALYNARLQVSPSAPGNHHELVFLLGSSASSALHSQVRLAAIWWCQLRRTSQAPSLKASKSTLGHIVFNPCQCKHCCTMYHSDVKAQRHSAVHTH